MQHPSVLVVVDMQLVAFDGKITPPINRGQSVLDNTVRLLQVYRAAGAGILYLQTCAMPGRPYSKDQHGWELHPVLAVRDDEPVVYKLGSSGFEGTDLHTVLGEMGAQRLVVCGIWSQHCVANTAFDAAELGYAVCVAKDAHGTVDADDGAADAVVRAQNEGFLARSFEVLDTAEIEAQLSQQPRD
ncbi:MAG: isochorismatase family cysteine hydrolase [Pseudomonadota bacterium]